MRVRRRAVDAVHAAFATLEKAAHEVFELEFRVAFTLESPLSAPAIDAHLTEALRGMEAAANERTQAASERASHRAVHDAGGATTAPHSA